LLRRKACGHGQRIQGITGPKGCGVEFDLDIVANGDVGQG
jgi:hypothetical protein